MPTSELERDELDQERTHLAAVAGPAGADARAHRLDGRGRRRRLGQQGVPPVHLRAADAPAPGRPERPALLRSPRLRRRRLASTSAADTCPSRAASRWSSTGGRRVSLPFYRATTARADGRGPAATLRLPARACSRPTRTRTWPPTAPTTSTPPSSRPRSSARASARCATSWRPSSPSRTSSCAPTSRRSIAVQGAPGTGKTAVGLHRAAYLLYAHREQLRRQGVLVVGPNEQLPALHPRRAAGARRDRGRADHDRGAGRQEPRGAQRALDDPRQRRRRRRHAQGRRAAGRGARTRGVGARRHPDARACVVPRGARRFRVAAYETEEILADLRTRGVRYGAARAMLPQALAHRILVKMELAGDSPDDRVQNAVARSRPVKEYAAALWPAVEPAKLVHRLLSDADALAAAADGILTADEQRRCSGTAEGLARHRPPWSLADAVLLDEATDLVERTPSLGHIVVDEAQDLSPMMLRAIGRRSSTGSVTVLGDLAQAHHPVGDPLLGRGARPPRQAAGARRGARPAGSGCPARSSSTPPGCSRTSPPTLAPPTSVRRSRGELRLRRERRPRPGGPRRRWSREGSVGLIVPDARLDEAERAVADLPHVVLGRDVPADSAAAAPWRPSSTPGSTSCRRRWRRVWSSTTSCCSTPRASSPASPTG